MKGSFKYFRQCTIPHFIPQGMVQDGHPVIVFPQRTHDVTIDRLYEFEIRMTNHATYVIDDEKYRVAHAICLTDVEGTEGDEIDKFIYGTTDNRKATLGDVSQLQSLYDSMVQPAT